jgi:hypothetical protein
MRTLFWLVIGATLGVCLAMILWSIPRISAAAGGLATFDMRPGGYTLEEARAFLAALSSEGAAFYRRVQLRLDIVYPGLLALATGWAILRLAPRWRFRRWLALVPLPAMAFDWLENASIARMLAAGPERLTAELAARATALSQAKAVASTVALSLLLALCLFAAVRWWRTRHGSG